MIVEPAGYAVVVAVTPRMGVRHLAVPVAGLVMPAAMDLGPAIRHPVVAATLRHPVAGMPDVAAALPLPEARRPDIASARGGDDLIDRRRRRRSDGKADVHARLRCRWRKHRRRDQRRRENRSGGKSGVKSTLHHDLPPLRGPAALAVV